VSGRKLSAGETYRPEGQQRRLGERVVTLLLLSRVRDHGFFDDTALANNAVHHRLAPPGELDLEHLRRAAAGVGWREEERQRRQCRVEARKERGGLVCLSCGSLERRGEGSRSGMSIDRCRAGNGR
jgi:hypothetical protein